MASAPKTTTTKKLGRPISQHTPAEKKQMSLEEEARQFYTKRVQEDSATASAFTEAPLRNLYAGFALSGLIASSKYSRAEEIVEEAFRYADIMVRYSNVA